MKIRFLEPANEELMEATEFYEAAAPGLGLEFLDEIERTLTRIQSYPDAWHPISQNHRRCLTRRFPYELVVRPINYFRFCESAMLPRARQLKPSMPVGIHGFSERRTRVHAASPEGPCGIDSPSALASADRGSSP